MLSCLTQEICSLVTLLPGTQLKYLGYLSTQTILNPGVHVNFLCPNLSVVCVSICSCLLVPHLLCPLDPPSLPHTFGLGLKHWQDGQGGEENCLGEDITGVNREPKGCQIVGQSSYIILVSVMQIFLCRYRSTEKSPIRLVSY